MNETMIKSAYIQCHVCSPSIRVVEARGTEVQGHSMLHREFKASLGYSISVIPVVLQELSQESKS